MAQVVIAWELGAGFGHLVPMAAIGTALHWQGHEVTFLVRPHARGVALMREAGHVLEEQPVLAAPVRAFPLSVNYSANLLRNGFWHSPTVQSRMAAWQGAVARHDPDLLICDHAPSALLATRSAPYPRVAIGTGFTVPPLAAPMPALQPWFPRPEAHLAAADREWLVATNQALGQMSVPPLESAASLFDNVSRFLCVEAELDHYDHRVGDEFVGTMEPPASWALAAIPPMGPERCVFVYLSPANPFLPSILRALDRLGWPTFAYVGHGPTAGSWPTSRTITYLTEPAALSSLAERCRLAITQGGAMLTSFFLRRDVPLLICPEDLEKAILGSRLSARGLAHTLNWFAPVPEDLVPTLEAIDGASDSMPARKAFAERYAGVSSVETAARVVQRVTRLMERSV